MEPNKKPSAQKLATAVSMVATALLLLGLLAYGGTPRQKQVSSQVNLGVVDRFYMNASNLISDAASGIAEIEKKYWISPEAEATPKAQKDCYGRSSDPKEVVKIMEGAETLLDGQKLYFSEDVELVEQTDVRYYLDDTIMVITWKQPIDRTVYTFSEIKITDPSQFRRYLSGGSYGSGKLAVPTEMANSVNAIVASSGDYYQFRSAGVIVYEGEVYRANGGADTCYIDRNGDLHFTRLGESMSMEKAKQFVEENDIQFSVAFGPILVENGQQQKIGGYSLGEISDPFARAALCQMGELHYLLVNANAEGVHNAYTTIYQFGKRIYETGAINAYALDGGQTAVIVMDGELINQMTRGYQRKISDIIYFATALPNVDG